MSFITSSLHRLINYRFVLISSPGKGVIISGSSGFAFVSRAIILKCTLHGSAKFCHSIMKSLVNQRFYEVNYFLGSYKGKKRFFSKVRAEYTPQAEVSWESGSLCSPDNLRAERNDKIVGWHQRKNVKEKKVKSDIMKILEFFQQYTMDIVRFLTCSPRRSTVGDWKRIFLMT